MKSQRIKKGIIIALSILMSINLMAQVDTTEIDVSDNNITVTNEESNDSEEVSNADIENLKKEIKSEEEKLKIYKDELDTLKEELKNTSDREKKEEIERNILRSNQSIIESNEKIIALETAVKGMEKGKLSFKDDFKKGFKKGFGVKKFNGHHKHIHYSHPFNWYNKMKKRYNGHWAGIEFGFTNFMNNSMETLSDDELDFMKLNSEKSWSIKLNLLEFNIPFISKRLGLTTGMGFEFNTWSLYNNVDIYEDENNIMVDSLVDKADKDFKRNRLNATYLTIPLILEFQLPTRRHKFYIGAGIEGSVRLWSQKSQKYFINNVKYRDRVSDDFQITPFRYSATVRIGYGPIGLFANYSLEPLFRSGHGPELYPFTVGLRLINF